MPVNSKRREEVQKVVLALLVSRKGATPLPVLERDYYEEEGERIPWRELGHASLLEFLQSLPNHIFIEKHNGIHQIRAVSDKSKHVSSLVARQKSTKKEVNSRRSFRPSHYFPSTPRPRIHIPAATLAAIVRLIKSNPEGVSKVRILDTVCQQLPHVNICMADLEEQLRSVYHEIYIDNNFVYPVQHQANQQENKTMKPDVDNSRSKSSASPKYFVSGTGNSSSSDFDSETNIQIMPSGYSRSMPTKKSKKNPQHKESATSNYLENATTNYETDDKAQFDMNSSKYNEGYTDHTQKYESTSSKKNQDYPNAEDLNVLISERIKFRLEKLIQKYPNGIWCADLPKKYEDEYNITLNYVDLGFNSVRDFVSHLPHIFHIVQPYEASDYIVFNARDEMPPRINKERITLANLHNIYMDNEVEAVPSEIPSDITKKLVPDEVLNIGETVGQICVLDLPTQADVQPHIEVFVVDVFSPSFFWIQLRKNKKKFEQMMKDMHEFYTANEEKYKIPMLVLEAGLNCACKYNNLWHRGIIKQRKHDSEVTVLFYDYGTLKTYPPTEVRYLHRQFSSMPAQAIPCGLVNVKPCKSREWTRGITHQFACKTSQNPLIATIAKADEETNSALITLTDTTEEEDVHINDWLVEQKLAVFGKTLDKVDMKNMLLYTEENLLYNPELCYAPEANSAEEQKESKKPSNESVASSPNASVPSATVTTSTPRSPPGITGAPNTFNLTALLEELLPQNPYKDASNNTIPTADNTRSNPYESMYNKNMDTLSNQSVTQQWKEYLQLQMRILYAFKAVFDRADPRNSLLNIRERVEMMKRIFQQLYMEICIQELDMQSMQIPNLFFNSPNFNMPNFQVPPTPHHGSTPTTNHIPEVPINLCSNQNAKNSAGTYVNGHTSFVPPCAANVQQNTCRHCQDVHNCNFVNSNQSVFPPKAGQPCEVFCKRTNPNGHIVQNMKHTNYTESVPEGRRDERVEMERMQSVPLNEKKTPDFRNNLNQTAYQFKETNPFKINLPDDVPFENGIGNSNDFTALQNTETHNLNVRAADYSQVPVRTTDPMFMTNGQMLNDNESQNKTKMVYEGGPVMYNLPKQNQEQHDIIENHISSTHNKMTETKVDTDVFQSRTKNLSSQSINLQNNVIYNDNGEINNGNLIFFETSDQSYNEKRSSHDVNVLKFPEEKSYASNDKYPASSAVQENYFANSNVNGVSAEDWINTVECSIKFKSSSQEIKSQELNGTEVIASTPNGVHSSIERNCDLLSARTNEESFEHNSVEKLEQSTNSDDAYDLNLITSRESDKTSLSTEPKIIFFQPVVLLPSKMVYVFYFEREAWLSVDEFTSGFTDFNTSTFLLELLDVLCVEVSLQEIKRSDCLKICSQLDRTKFKAVRDDEGKIVKINLISLKSAMMVLRKFKIITIEDTKLTRNDYAEGSVMYELWMVMNAYNRLKQDVDKIFVAQD